MAGITSWYLRYRWVPVQAGLKGNTILSWPALYMVPLCTYISAWLIQVSGHAGLVLSHSHRQNTGTVRAGMFDNKYQYQQKNVLLVHP